MRRLVIDTTVYIDWLNAGLHEDVLFQRGTVKHLSAVVLTRRRVLIVRSPPRAAR
jgi:hypothetical protein